MADGRVDNPTTTTSPTTPAIATTGRSHGSPEFALRRADLVAQIGDVSFLARTVTFGRYTTDGGLYADAKSCGGVQSLEQVLAQINALNRNIEAIVEVSTNTHASTQAESRRRELSCISSSKSSSDFCGTSPDWKRLCSCRGSLESVRDGDECRVNS